MPEVLTFSLGRKVAYYMMASYLYYVKDYSLLDDAVYDKLCHELADRWLEITHPHKKFMHLDLLACGSGFGMEFPSIVKSAAERLVFGD